MFTPSKEKKRITSNDDLGLIKALSFNLNRKLLYLGLPGPMVNDLITWREFLQECICVERDEETKDQVLRSLFVTGLTELFKYHVIHSDIEDFLINKLQYCGHPSFDIANLDYFGPPIVINKAGGSSRKQSWEHLFTFQTNQKREDPFVIFITTSVRNKDDGEIDQILNKIKNENRKLTIPTGNTPGQEHLKMKFIIPYMMREAALREKWNLDLMYSYTYLSDRSRMVHFAFWAEPTSKLFPTHKQSDEDVWNIDMIDLSAN